MFYKREIAIESCELIHSTKHEKESAFTLTLAPFMYCQGIHSQCNKGSNYTESLGNLRINV